MKKLLAFIKRVFNRTHVELAWKAEADGIHVYAIECDRKGRIKADKLIGYVEESGTAQTWSN